MGLQTYLARIQSPDSVGKRNPFGQIGQKMGEVEISLGRQLNTNSLKISITVLVKSHASAEG